MKPERDKYRRSAKTQTPPATPRQSIVLGHCLDDFMSERDLSLWPLSEINTHGVILGKPNEGKTTTAKKIYSETFAKDEDAQVFTIDLGNDPDLARAFGSTAKKLGKTVRFYPQERVSVWSGDWRTVFFRLRNILPLAKESTPAAHYTAKAVIALELACRMGGKPPRSIVELLERLDYPLLKKKFGPKGLRGVEPKHVEEDLYARCRELASYIGTSMDGEWSFGDVDGAYLGLDAAVLGHGVVVTLRMLLAALLYYVKEEKPRNRRCLIVIDEFAALSDEVSVSIFVEQVRKLGVGVILMSQTVAGMGDEAQIKRTVRNAGRLILHSSADWDELKSVLPVEVVDKISMAIGDGEDAEPDRIQHEDEYVFNQGDLLGLSQGQVMVVRKNEAALVEVVAPDDSGDDEFELPPQEDILFYVEEIDEVETEISAPGFGKGDPPVESFSRRGMTAIPDIFKQSDLHPESADSNAGGDAESGTVDGADSTDE